MHTDVVQLVEAGRHGPTRPRVAGVRDGLDPGPPGHHDIVTSSTSARATSATRPEADVGPHHAGLRGGEDHLRTRQARQHLVGPDGVEGGEPVEEGEDDAHGCVSSPQAGVVRARARNWARYWPGVTPSVPLDRPVHGLDRPESAGRGDLGRWPGGGLEQPARPFDAEAST